MNRLGDDRRFLLAQLYMDQGEESKYQDEMQKLLAAKARNSQHLAHFANHWIDHNQLDQADRWLAEVKKAYPGAVRRWSWRPACSICGSAGPSYWRCCSPAVEKSPQEIGAVADLLSRYGFAKEAETAYKAFIASEPRQPERSLALARFLASQDRVSRGDGDPQEGLDDLPCRSGRSYGVARSTTRLRQERLRNDRSKPGWPKWLRNGRMWSLSATSLGVIWILRGRFDEAEALYRRVLQSNPDNAEVLNSLAWLLAMKDPTKAEEALGLISKAVAVSGRHPTLIDTLAVVLIRANRLDQAVDQLTDAQKRAPNKSSLALHLAWAYEGKGQSEDSRKQFLRAEELGLKIQTLDPLENAIVRKLRARLFPQ